MQFFEDCVRETPRLDKVLCTNDFELPEMLSDYAIDDECVAQQINSEWLSMSFVKRGNQDLFGLASSPRQVQTPEIANKPKSDFCSVNQTRAETEKEMRDASKSEAKPFPRLQRFSRFEFP